MSRRRIALLFLIATYLLLIGQTYVLLTAVNKQTAAVKVALCDALRVSIESDISTAAYLQKQSDVDDEQTRRIIARLDASFTSICGQS